MTARGTRTLLRMLAMAVTAAAVAAVPVAGGDGPCIRALVPSTVVLPDGTAHRPGVLRVCVAARISPVRELHAVWLDGRPIGAFAGTLDRAEDPDPAESALFVFRRHGGSRLALEAYAVTVGGRRQVYRLVPDAGLVAGRRSPEAEAWRDDAGLVLVRAGPR